MPTDLHKFISFNNKTQKWTTEQVQVLYKLQAFWKGSLISSQRASQIYSIKTIVCVWPFRLQVFYLQQKNILNEHKKTNSLCISGFSDHTQKRSKNYWKRRGFRGKEPKRLYKRIEWKRMKQREKCRQWAKGFAN